ncbi:hypothetical protein Dimus_010777 [Dionaea muscipula]
MVESGVSNPQLEPSEAAESEQPTTTTTTAAKWPGWPGDNVFRLIVPVLKVGGIIGRKGELVKKICEETRARVRILEAPLGTTDRVVLISGQEDPDLPVSPAMDAVLRVFKQVTDLSSIDADDNRSATAAAFCSIKLLIPLAQAINLIGRQGSTIKSIQENSGAVVRISTEDELPSYASSDERIVEIHSEALKVLKALEGVIRHLRKFLVDRSVISVIEKNDHATDVWIDRSQPLAECAPPKTLIGPEHSFSLRHDPYFDHEINLDSQVLRSGPSLYSEDELLSRLHPTGLARSAAAVVTQVTQTMQVPLSYAEDIIGIRGDNIAYIRRNSGAVLTVQETRGLADEITVEIRGTLSQVQKAQQLIQEFLSSPRGSATGAYGPVDAGVGSYSRFLETSYLSPYSTNPPPGGYGSVGSGSHNFRF